MKVNGMTTKIKEFKGSLNPIFNGDIKNEVAPEPQTHIAERAAKDFLPIDHIKPRSDQPRKIFNESSLNELAQSIKSKGVIQPIIVRSIGKDIYEIIVGERRWRAAKKVGLENIPVVIREYDRPDALAVALIENIQRDNLNPLEEANAIQSLLDECALTHHQVAESIGRSRTAVSNILRLLALTDEVKTMVNAGLLEMGHARALLSLTDEQQIEAARMIVSRALSVRETEKLVHQINTPQEKQLISINPEFERKATLWKANLSRQLSSKVNIQFGAEGAGKVVIHFNSIDEADWLMDHIAVSETVDVD